MASKVARASAFANPAVVARAALAESAATADKQGKRKTNRSHSVASSQKSDTNGKVMIRVSQANPASASFGMNEAALERMPGWLDAELFGSRNGVGDIVRDVVD